MPNLPTLIRQMRLIYLSTLIGTAFILAVIFSRPAYPEVSNCEFGQILCFHEAMAG